MNALIYRNYQILGTEIHVDIFDDRMEIMSPGGMMSGSRIQNMNKEHIPSMRRNEKISDIFGRLGFMDRRGSGIQRILNSYKNYSHEPTFYSDENIFLVTMPNRSFTGAKRVQKIPAQYTGKITLANKSNVQTAEKSALANKVSGQTVEKGLLANKVGAQNFEKSFSEYEIKAEDLPIRLDLPAVDNVIDAIVEICKQKNRQGAFKDRTLKQLAGFYTKYKSDYSFNRDALAVFFNIGPDAATKIIRKYCGLGIMRREKRSVYFFINLD